MQLFINLESPLASRTKRFFAAMIDLLMTTLVVMAAFYLFFGFDDVFRNFLERPGSIEERRQFLFSRNMIRNISFLLYVFYGALMEGTKLQGTLGKYWMGIRSADYDSNPLNFSKALQRNFWKILSMAPLSLGFIWILFDKRRQGWHDKLAKTLVLERSIVP